MRSESLPVVAIGKNSDGLPTRLSIPAKLTRPIAVMSGGKRIGEVAVDGSVSWTGPGAARDWYAFVATAGALNHAASARGRLRVAIIDGKVSAIVVPPERTRGNKRI